MKTMNVVCFPSFPFSVPNLLLLVGKGFSLKTAGDQTKRSRTMERSAPHQEILDFELGDLTGWDFGNISCGKRECKSCVPGYLAS